MRQVSFRPKWDRWVWDHSDTGSETGDFKTIVKHLSFALLWCDAHVPQDLSDTHRAGELWVFLGVSEGWSRGICFAAGMDPSGCGEASVVKWSPSNTPVLFLSHARLICKHDASRLFCIYLLPSSGCELAKCDENVHTLNLVRISHPGAIARTWIREIRSEGLVYNRENNRGALGPGGPSNAIFARLRSFISRRCQLHYLPHAPLGHVIWLISG